MFTFMLDDENARPGTISKATFARGRVTLEYYDHEGLDTLRSVTFQRRTGTFHAASALTLDVPPVASA